MDRPLTLAIYGLAHQSVRGDALIVFLATWLVIILVAAVVVIVLRLPRAARVRVGVRVAAAVAIAYTASQLIGAMVFRERPFVADPERFTALIARDAGDKSFPSDHATVAFALSFSVWPVLRRRSVRVALFVIATAIAFGRVAAGVHYLSDVIAGALLALLVAYGVTRLQRPGTQETSVAGGPP